MEDTDNGKVFLRLRLARQLLILIRIARHRVALEVAAKDTRKARTKARREMADLLGGRF